MTQILKATRRTPGTLKKLAAHIESLDAEVTQLKQQVAQLKATQKGSSVLPTIMPGHIDPTLALFAQWAKEDATEDVAELARRDQEWQETEANLAANRLTLRDVNSLPVNEEAA